MSAMRTGVLPCTLLVTVTLTLSACSRPRADNSSGTRRPRPVSFEKDLFVDSAGVTVHHPRKEWQPEPVSVPPPILPDSLRAAFHENRLWVEVLVDTDGSAIDARVFVSSGHPALDTAGIYAARRSKWKPLVYCGRPYRFWASWPLPVSRKKPDWVY
jgi:TonB family protein